MLNFDRNTVQIVAFLPLKMATIRATRGEGPNWVEGVEVPVCLVSDFRDQLASMSGTDGQGTYIFTADSGAQLHAIQFGSNNASYISWRGINNIPANIRAGRVNVLTALERFWANEKARNSAIAASMMAGFF